MPSKLLQITDCHLKADKNTLFHNVNPYQRLANCLAYAHKQTQSNSELAAILLTGDLVQDEVESSYQQLVELVNQYPWSVPICLVPGNHDEPNLFAQAKNAIGAYSMPLLELGQWQIALFDSFDENGHGGGRIDEAQVDYIYQLLNQSSAQFLLAVLHHHLLPYGGFIDNYPLRDSEYFYSWAVEQAKSARNKLTAVVHGHVHAHKCRYLDLIPVYGSIASSVQFEHSTGEINSCQYGLTQVTLYEDGQVTTQAIYL
ncbi:cyclic 3',5'-adenosine monophosphate phosphodiesterase [Catenovulum agarivorans DS-2]|uniref:Cyclic 3',5'-adenosine monophosphate phosphodiesterase n=1 Tax=Catenovulum agarivorans DS-2 TaxID=1328313 RepID=W7QWZ0_9ALTE|nr:metallophosphoesterase [Catenovulum agarivorans]EWH12248.1 cyclic 3',5'-adenosine monophosphate phosphodiesterase [Catenovulum agarivorans DS-2]